MSELVAYDATGHADRGHADISSGLLRKVWVSAMVRAWKVRTPFLMWHGVLMLCLGMALYFLGSFMTTPKVEALGYSVAVLLTALCLLGPGIIACIKGIAHGAWRSRKSYIYMLAIVASLACWLVFWINQSTPLDIHLLVLLAGLHGIFWGMWYLGLAFRLQGQTRKVGLLCLLAGTTSAVGLVLATQSQLTDTIAVVAVACYTTWIGVQILLTAPYLFRDLERKADEEILADRPVQVEQRQLA